MKWFGWLCCKKIWDRVCDGNTIGECARKLIKIQEEDFSCCSSHHGAITTGSRPTWNDDPHCKCQKPIR